MVFLTTDFLNPASDSITDGATPTGILSLICVFASLGANVSATGTYYHFGSKAALAYSESITLGLLIYRTISIQRSITQYNERYPGVAQKGVTHQVVVIVVESAILFSTAVVITMVLVLCNTSPAIKDVLADSVREIFSL